MKLTPTLSRYLARRYFINLVYLLLILLAVLYVLDVVELIRRASKHAEAPLGLILQMSLLKMPKEAPTLFPFAVLYSAIFTFWQLTRRYELVVVRAAGFSFWQFLTPVIGVAMLAGVLHMTVINPVGALLVGKYEQIQRAVIERKESEIALFKEGLWLRQGTEEGYLILHSRKIQQPGIVLQNPMALFFTHDDQYLRRIDAGSARLENDRWLFTDVTIQTPGGAQKEAHVSLPTNLTRDEVENSFSRPETMSFWQLPANIQTLEETGFDASRLRVHYHGLLAQPLLFAAMVLLAAAVALRPPRAHGALVPVIAGVFIGFVVFFMSSFLQAMGTTQQIPVLLAAWSPALITLLFGLGVMMHLEDG